MHESRLVALVASDHFVRIGNDPCIGSRRARIIDQFECAITPLDKAVLVFCGVKTSPYDIADVIDPMGHIWKVADDAARRCWRIHHMKVSIHISAVTVTEPAAVIPATNHLPTIVNVGCVGVSRARKID